MIRLSDVRYTLRLWRRHPAMVVVAGSFAGAGRRGDNHDVRRGESCGELPARICRRRSPRRAVDQRRAARHSPAAANWEIVRAILDAGRHSSPFGFFQGGGAPVTLSTTDRSDARLADAGRRKCACRSSA